MQRDISPENTQTRRALPALFIPMATFPGWINIPDAIVLLKMRLAAVKDDNNCRLDGTKVKRYYLLTQVAEDEVKMLPRRNHRSPEELRRILRW
jgi:hypothetical protein